MNLLIFIHSLHSGGAERVTANLANYWAEKGWKIAVVTLSSAKEDFYRLHPSVERIALGLARDSGNPLMAILNNLRRVVVLRRVLRDTRPNIALGMMTTANVLLSLAQTGLKGIITVGSERIHPPRVPLGAMWEILRARTYRRLKAVVALTGRSADWLRAHTRASNIRIIPNAASWPLDPQPPCLPVPPRLDAEHVLLAVGRLDEQKGFDLLIAAFQRLAARFPEWRLIVLGEGPRRNALEAQVASAGLTGRVDLPGRAGNIGQWYEAADLYAMSSRFEGFPNTLVEAMAHGLPVVSFDCDTGPGDIVRHERDGLLVPPENAAELEVTLGRLMADNALRRRFAQEAIDVRQRLSLERIARQWEDLFEEMR
ncbi:MAG: glycosyltransferase family 4 protein [Burkholderiaceae bacterium]|nr:glycosyltransferase family 4 protein [Burkholderiaceae bacterium]